MSEEVKIIEKKEVPSGAIMLFGFPDVGLVGVIAASPCESDPDRSDSDCRFTSYKRKLHTS